MATIPSAICMPCRRAYVCDQVGVTLELWTSENGRPYYLVQADIYRCPGCGHQVASEFAETVTMNYDADFKRRQDQAPGRIKVW